MSGHRVDEGAVRHLDRDAVAGSKGVDERERREVRPAVAGNIDEAVLAGHEGAQVSPGALLECLVVGAVDEEHAQTDVRNPEPADRLAALRADAVAPGSPRDACLLRGEGGARDRAFEAPRSLRS